jgi:hypothetical protein
MGTLVGKFAIPSHSNMITHANKDIDRKNKQEFTRTSKVSSVFFPEFIPEFTERKMRLVRPVSRNGINSMTAPGMRGDPRDHT